MTTKRKILIGIMAMAMIASWMATRTEAAITLWYLDGTTLRPVDPTWTVAVTSSTFGADFDARLTATTTLPKITTLTALSITSGQVSDIASYWDNRFNGTTTDALTEGTSNLYWTTNRADVWWTASSTMKMTNLTVTGTLTGTLTGNADTASSDSTWTLHNSYPAACGAGEFASAIGDTLTCSVPAGGSVVGTVSTSTTPLLGGIAYWTSAGYPSLLGTVATGTISASGGVTVTAGRSAIGGSLAITCTAADTNNTGCLSDTDWDTFNGKLSTIGSGTNGQLSYWRGANDLTGIGTTTLTASSPLSLDNPVVKVGGSNSILTISTAGTWSGLAGSATILATARAINGVNFDGSGPITITAASSTLLANNNTLTGTNAFTGALTLGSTSGFAYLTSGLLSASSTLYLGTGTTTANNGINISAGCFAVGGTCVGGGDGSLIGSALTKGYFVVANNGNLSQATSSPSIDSATSFLLLQKVNDAAGDTTGIKFKISKNIGPSYYYSGILVARQSGSGYSDLHFVTQNTGELTVPNAKLSILYGGNVGIGTTNPVYKFDVNGDIRTNGTLWATTTNATNASITYASSTAITASQNLFIGSNSGYITGTSTSAFNIASTTLDTLGKSFNTGTTTLLLANYSEPFTLTGIYCKATSTAATSQILLFQIVDGAGNYTNTGTCNTTGVYTTITTNNAFTALEEFQVVASSTCGAIRRATLTITRYKTGL